ncbi:VHS and GAT domain containing protein [Musa troglodytarum]|uniref:VHS and GAT domain containing protein n=1 Tax=Musa troglodytarum TaxID=320322 RepID=A0A9E7FT16_9LILI|nr:VHS and GAT domain containing protein [Musa troglodytarum]
MEVREPDGVTVAMGEPVAASVAEPPRIVRLDESVVNRIAAGEVIQRPVSAVKELVENSLDAGSTSISVVVKDGGLKLIQVSDNGHGIRSEDLPILCERHTTSKLSAYEDLQSIKSMGFRGEALASMTYVGHVTVTTITEGQMHGYRVSYRDGVMEHEPKPCAAVRGTQIMVENLFYNMIARRKTLQNANDDYTKIVDLISRFAIHNSSVSFSCRKHGVNRADVHTVTTLSKLDAIKTIYGISVARDLMEITASDDNPSQSIFEMNGFISNANYTAKKTTMILFINDRLVECTALKRAIEVVYSSTLPKASRPFIYMSIKLPSEHVDVNIHPTKREVSLLNQESLIETIQNAVESKLMNCNTTRTFQTQTVSCAPASNFTARKDTQISPASGTKSQKVPVNQMVRTDSRDPFGRLHAYWQDCPASQHEKKSDLASVRIAVRQRRNPRESADLTSIHELLNEIDQNIHPGLLEIVKSCTYIGLADEVFALLQHNTHLYLVNVVNVSKELMYQQVIRRFAHFNAIQLSEPAPLPELLILALKDEDLDSGGDNDDELRKKIAEMNTELLKQKGEMLEEYFCININQEGNLTRLPVILEQHTPDMDHIPEFLLSLANDVDWENEKECFQAISAVLGNFYAMHPPVLPNPAGNGIEYYKKIKDKAVSIDDAGNELTGTDNHGQDDLDQELLAEAETAWAQREWNIQHVLFPSMRLFLKPPKSMATDGTFIQVIFSRCLIRSRFAMATAAAFADRATSDVLIGPDWATNMELCDIINTDPGQGKDALKILKKRLGSKNPKIQLLALFVLETLSKNCGDNVHQQIVERDILHEMVKIVKKKPDLNVREKILVLIDTWQEAFGGAGGKYTQYHAAYQELRAMGVEFPPHTENTAAIFTPPQTHPLAYQPATSAYENMAIESSLQSDVSAFSLQDIQNVRGIADVLSEMLNALDPKNPEDLRQEVIVDLVEQCHSYKKHVMLLVNNTGDEELLFQGLALNDDLQLVLERHDDMSKGTAPSVRAPVASTVPLVNVIHEDDQLEDDFSELSLRTSRDNATAHGREASTAKSPSPFLPPPQPSKPISTDTSRVNYLSGDVFRSELALDAPANPPVSPATLSPVIPSASAPSLESDELPRCDEPLQAAKFSTDQLPKVPREPQPSGLLPPPPSKYGQRQQFFEQQKHGLSGGDPGVSFNGSVDQNWSFHSNQENTSLGPKHDQQHLEGQNMSPSARQTKPEDALFKDLVDFAKAKSSSPTKPSNSRRTR